MIDKSLNEIKIIDFGLSTTIEMKKNNPKEQCGTLLTNAPELLAKEDYCAKVDCWAIGIVMFEMITK